MATTVLTHTAASEPLAPRLTIGQEVAKFVRTKPLGAGGAAIILAMLVVGAFSEVLAPYDPYSPDYALQFARPSAEHWFGTDEFGRDLMSRLIYGARIALFVGFTASFIGCTLGGLLGVISAYVGGKVDLFLERLMDILLAFPQLILALAIASILGPAVQNVVIAIAIPIIPRAARVVRSTALSVKENVYVEAVQALGAAQPRIVLRHIVPNVVAPYIIMLTAQLGGGHPGRSCPKLPGPGRGRAHALVGTDALGVGPVLRGEGTLDRGVPRDRHQPRGLRLQSLRRLPARRARPQAAGAVSAAADLASPSRLLVGRTARRQRRP
jgi:peptide/nickel transport system permease protein